MEVYIGKCDQCPYVIAAEHLTLLREAGGYHCGAAETNKAERHSISELGPVDLLQYPSRVNHQHIYLSDSPNSAACVSCGAVWDRLVS